MAASVAPVAVRSTVPAREAPLAVGTVVLLAAVLLVRVARIWPADPLPGE